MRVHSSYISTPLIWIILFISALNVYAQSIDCVSNPIKLAFYEYGYFYYDNGRGIDRDIVNEIIKRSGCRFQTEVMTRARIWAELKKGTLDMSVLAIQTPERDEFAWFIHYLTMKNYAIINKKTAGDVRGARSFIANSRLQFGVVRSFKHGTEQDNWLSELRRQQRVQESPDVETVFKKLKDGRVDAMFSQPPVYIKRLKDFNMQDNVLIQDWTPSEKGVPHGLVLSKVRFSARDALFWREIINKMRNDGTLRRIYLKYLPAEEVKIMLDY